MKNDKIPYDNPRAMLAMDVPFPGTLLLSRLLILRTLRKFGATTTDTAIQGAFEVVDTGNREGLLSQIEKIAGDNNMDSASAWFYGKTDGESAWMIYAMAPAVARTEIIRSLCSALVDPDPPTDQKKADNLLRVLQRNLSHD